MNEPDMVAAGGGVAGAEFELMLPRTAAVERADRVSSGATE